MLREADRADLNNAFSAFMLTSFQYEESKCEFLGIRC